MSKLIWRLAALGTMALALTACGGGGGGGADPPPVGPAVKLTTDNYVTAAKIGLESAAGVMDIGEWLTGVERSRADNMLFFVVEKARSALRRRASGSEWPVGITDSWTEPCSGGGTIRYVDGYASEDKTSVGDSTELTFTNCVEDGATIAGTIRGQIIALSGDIDESDTYKIDADVAVTNLKVTMEGSTQTGNGTLKLSIDSRDWNDVTVLLKTASFTTKGTVGSEAYERTLSDYAVEWTEGPSITKITATGKVTASELGGGSVTVSTPTAFEVRNWEDYPYKGVMLAEGADGSRARLTALSAAQARIELDADGDGSYETSSTKSWDDLLGG